MSLFFVGEDCPANTGNGIAKSRPARLVGDREGELGAVGRGSLDRGIAEGEHDAKVLVKAESLGGERSGRSASGIVGNGVTSLLS